MGQRAMAFIEKENGNYDGHYCHWFPMDFNPEKEISEEKPLGGLFREEPEVTDIPENEIKMQQENEDNK